MLEVCIQQMESKVHNTMGRQKDWINCAKFLAIFAVLIDHTNYVLYSNQHIALASYYSVSLFVLISGYLCYSSNIKHNRTYGQTIIKSCKRITLAYLLATFIYIISIYKFFDFQVYIDAVIHFNASGPFYYVFLYIQLMIANKAIYKLLVFSEKYNKILEMMYDIGLGIVLLIIASLTTNYTNILGIYGGGGKLLGGTYLFLFFIGMILNKYNVFSHLQKLTLILISGVAGIAYWGWWRIMCKGYQSAIDSKFPFGGGYNPPSITFSVLAIFMMFLCFGFFALCSLNSISNTIPKMVGWIGQHTLYIFLYHRLWLDFYLVDYVTIDNIHIKRVVFYSVMVFASIALEYVVCGCKKLLYVVLCETSMVNDK